MQRYIALLRGINVGGKNKIAMSELKAVFEEIGFCNVSSYINSGNIIFSSDNANETEIQKQFEHAIAGKFKLAIAVAIISEQALSDALEHAPAWWGADEQSTHNAIFIISPATAETVLAQVGPATEYELVDSYGQVIFWSAKLKTYARTRWSKIVGTPVYACVTMRNLNTTKKILQLAK